ncbi:MAG: hypothetical protein AB4063_12385, partial [Crocosphaera sp.]
LFCRSLIEYLQESTDLDLTIIDLDPVCWIGKTYASHHYTPKSEDLSQKESNCQDDLQLQIPFIKISAVSEEIQQGDVILELALQGKNVIVNLPSRSFDVVNNWLYLADILHLSKQMRLPIWQWFNTDGNPDSIDILKKSYQLYGDSINHVIIKNKVESRMGFSRWTLFNNEPELQSYLQASQRTYFVTMPTVPMANFCWDIIQEKQLTFTKAKHLQCKWITITNKHAIHTWLKVMFGALSLIPLETYEHDEQDDSSYISNPFADNLDSEKTPVNHSFSDEFIDNLFSDDVSDDVSLDNELSFLF